MDPVNAGPPPSDGQNTTTTTTPPGARPPRTREEQSVLDVVARRLGQPYVDRWAESILAQARAIGDL